VTASVRSAPGAGKSPSDSHATGGRPLDSEITMAILEATVDLLTRTGYSGLSIDAVARRAGVHRPAVYRRFSSKVELVAAAIGAYTTAIPDPATGCTRDDLVSFIRRVATILHRDERARLALRVVTELAADEKFAALVNARTVRPWRDLAAVILRRGVETGELRSDLDVVLVTDLLLGPAYGRALIGRPQLTRAGAERLVDTLFEGLRAPGRRR
jgi:AcrR family transcriptional regulator